MTALLIIGGILAAAAIILSFSLTVYVGIKDEITVKIGAFGYKYQLVPSKPKKEKPPKPEKQKRKKEIPELKETRPEEMSFGDTVSFVINLLKAILPNAAVCLKHLRFLNIKIYLSVACDDAEDTAIRYGEANAAIMTVLGAVSASFKTKLKACKIRADFVRETSLYDISFKAKLRLFHILFAAFGMLPKLLSALIKKPKPKKKQASSKNKPTDKSKSADSGASADDKSKTDNG